jgi:hypothetical protein
MCTDGCPTMLGVYNGLIALIKKTAPHVKFTHCMIHRGSLASKQLPQNLKIILGKKYLNLLLINLSNHLIKISNRRVGKSC